MPIIKIAVVGPESTGKSALSEKLAVYFDTEWVPEFAREYLDSLDRPYQKEDLLSIAKGQMAVEDKILLKANRLLICDTNLVVIKIWSDIRYGHCDDWIIDEMKKRKYGHYLLMDVDLPWEYDPHREHPHMREFLLERYKEELTVMGASYSIISGNYRQRFERAKQIVAKYFE